ncbi:hypothetical protein Vlu01_41730 [Micromonospora lutea]|uniref:EamA family transporter n=1 Tax=Micromonospora lutea TaxID=419825 RepID=A0ABQ4J075_9ACTN|nr:hypothetical protein Vlu01_41730 [Micromonospora lutea]
MAGRPSRLRVALTWLAGNALIGYFWIFPLGAVDGGAVATVVVQLLPFACFLLFTDRTVPPFL